MTKSKPLYVAETNEAGNIICVWRTSEDGKKTRPIADAAPHLALLPSADVYGATTEAISDWLQSKANEAYHA